MKKYSIVACLLLFLLGCKQDDSIAEELSGCPSAGVLENFTSPEGETIYIYENGDLFILENGNCNFLQAYFDPGFLEDNYSFESSSVALIEENGNLFPTKNNYLENFEALESLPDLFILSSNDIDKYWTNFTLQSPATPEVSDYVTLANCILSGSCTFIDNRIELVQDPMDSDNQVLKFTTVPPVEGLVTSKASISSTINFYEKNDEVWFEADYFIESGIPFSIVDFETSYFFQSPGPRVVLRDNKLEFENKFGAKLNIENTTGMRVSSEEWFTLKVHLKYSNTDDGIVEIWQNGTLIISQNHINLPTSNAVQNILEVGATASSEACVLLFDNMRISDTAF